MPSTAHALPARASDQVDACATPPEKTTCTRETLVPAAAVWATASEGQASHSAGSQVVSPAKVFSQTPPLRAIALRAPARAGSASTAPGEET